MSQMLLGAQAICAQSVAMDQVHEPVGDATLQCKLVPACLRGTGAT